MEYRIEHDTMGEIKVPMDKYWGAQTQRSLENFKIGKEKMPEEIINALVILKYACAKANYEIGKLSENKYELIEKVSKEILDGKYLDNFPLVVWQTGSGTQSNMNVNEVIANIGNKIAGEKILHPNDTVNMSQSSNDTYPTALHIAAKTIVHKKLIPAMDKLISALDKLSKENEDIIKIGRTHLQDATPLTLGQEISGWMAMITETKDMILSTLSYVSKVAIGGTAVGTGLNSPKDFDKIVTKYLSEITGYEFVPDNNKFHGLTSKDAITFSHGALKALGCNLMKIANDIRFLASGPRSGIGELIIPENEPGSSIMPGKVNPTQCEAVTMVAVQVMGNDSAIGIAASQGNFELNVFMPVIAYNYIQSVTLLSDCINSFTDNCVVGIKPNIEVINHNLNNSLMLVTALNPYIGYENAAKIAKYAHKNNTTLKEAAIKLELLTSEEYDKYVKPENMVR